MLTKIYTMPVVYIAIMAIAFVTTRSPLQAQLYTASDSQDALILIENDGTTAKVGDFGDDISNMSGMLFNPLTNTVYGVNNSTDSLYTINTSTGATTLIGDTGVNITSFSGFTFDYNSSIAYLARANGAGGAISYTTDYYTVNLSTGAVQTSIGNSGISARVAGLAYDNNTDTLYAISNDDSDVASNADSLYTVSTTDGSMNRIGALGITISNGGLTFDQDGRLLLIRNNNPDNVYELNTSTGVASLLIDLDTNTVNGVSLVSVPEPATASALLLAGGLLLYRRRRS